MKLQIKIGDNDYKFCFISPNQKEENEFNSLANTISNVDLEINKFLTTVIDNKGRSEFFFL